MQDTDYSTSFDAIEQAIEKQPALKEAMLETQRKAQKEGWAKEKYVAALQALLSAEDVQVSPEALLAMIKDSQRDFADDELDAIAGGAIWGKNCNKRKICPGGTGRSCYPHC